MARSPRTFRIQKRTIIGVLAVILIVGGLYVFLAWRSTKQFEKQFGDYAKAQEIYITAAYKPAADSNPVRQAVNVLLAQVLQADMTPAVRLEKAKQGIAHLNDMEGQIDEIKDEADVVIPMLDSLEKTARSDQAKEIVAIGRRQVEIVSDIRGLSYRADYYTDEVFERIIDDQGQMTDAHKLYLNDLIPQLEEQFNKRTNLYTELTQNQEKQKKIAEALGYTVTK